MVFFNCNNCSEALKGNKVEVHKGRCNFSSLTCVDCLKDFDIITFKQHKTCMTEDQRYGGKNYVGKEMKGQKKQEQWLDKLQNLISTSKFSKGIENYLNRIINYDNIPRKKPKFINFVKASIVKDVKVAEKLWTIIEQALKSSNSENESTNAKKINDKQHLNKQTNDDQQTNGKQVNKSTKDKDSKLNESTNKLKDEECSNEPCYDNIDTVKKSVDEMKVDNLKRKMNDSIDQNSEIKKVKIEDLNKSSIDLDESIHQDESIDQVIQNLIERSKESQTEINPIKLTKKILKRKENKEMRLKKFKKLIRRLIGYTEFKDLPLNEYYDKFIEKLNEKDYFVINREMIVYKI